MICFSISPGGPSSSTSSSSLSLLTSPRTIPSDFEDDPSRPYGRCSSPSGCHQFIKTQGCLIALLTSPRLVVLLSSLNRYAPASSLVTARVLYPVLLCIRFPRSIPTSILQSKISPPTEKPFYLHHFLKVLIYSLITKSFSPLGPLQDKLFLFSFPAGQTMVLVPPFFKRGVFDYSLGPAPRPGRVMELKCLSACLCVCLSPSVAWTFRYLSYL